ncbi:MAG: hypothetical protein LBI35_01295 [Burkholderiales bacterium]|jgi:hypothetical protein|nr:hypothetical protein [Burkholderiales bacterium]
MRPLNHLWPLLQEHVDATRAGMLVEIDLHVPVRLCSWDEVVWQGELWTRGELVSAQLQSQTSYAKTGTLVISDPDHALLATMLASGIVGAPIKIWYAPTFNFSEEPVMILDAFADLTQVSQNEARTLSINIAADDGAHLFSPRERVTTADYPDPLPGGAVIKFGQGKITLMGMRS